MNTRQFFQTRQMVEHSEDAAWAAWWLQQAADAGAPAPDCTQPRIASYYDHAAADTLAAHVRTNPDLAVDVFTVESSGRRCVSVRLASEQYGSTLLRPGETLVPVETININLTPVTGH